MKPTRPNSNSGKKPSRKPEDSVLGNEKRLQRFQDIVSNIAMTRRELFKNMLERRKDIDTECDYPKSPVPIETYYQMWEREDVAARVVEIEAKESWQVLPSVYESDDPNIITDFERDWVGLADNLLGTTNYYQGNTTNIIFKHLIDVDVLSGIGSYGILLIGMNDGKQLSEPAEFVDGQPLPDSPLLPGGRDASRYGSYGGQSADDMPGIPLRQYADEGADDNTETPLPFVSKSGAARQSKYNLTYLRAFPESLAQITAFEDDRLNPRYGQPTKYLVTLNDPSTNQSGIGLSTTTEEVHWTRVIHVADTFHTASTSGVFAVPRQRPHLNRLFDVRKLYGGSAEMYWAGAMPGWSFESNPQLGTEVDVDYDDILDQMEDYRSGLQRFITLMGLTAKSLAPQVVDPTPQITVQLQAICIKLNVPISVFTGSQMGKIAGSDDRIDWNKSLIARQNNYITPSIIVPVVNRFISLGILSKPESFKVWWPDLTAVTANEKAPIAVQQAQALSIYVTNGLDAIMTFTDFMTLVLGLSEDQAQQVAQNIAAAGPPPQPVPEAGQAGIDTTRPDAGGLGSPIPQSAASAAGTVGPSGEAGGAGGLALDNVLP